MTTQGTYRSRPRHATYALPRMSDIGVEPEIEAAELGFEAYGVRGVLSAFPDALLARARSLLPPGWRTCPPTASRFSIAQSDGRYDVRVDDASRTQTIDLELALGVLDAQIRAYVALRAPQRIFVHAGVVGCDGGAIVIPGRSFSGKTTLVAALIRAGAAYYSDEFAVLDERGWVYPYPKPLSIRGDAARPGDHPAASLGAAVGSNPLPVGLIAATSYRPGARWQPQRQTPGTGAMALFSNTVPARERPQQALAAVRHAAASALVLEGERGEASEMAGKLLDALQGNGPP
jgi:hypothetical protein